MATIRVRCVDWWDRLESPGLLQACVNNAMATGSTLMTTPSRSEFLFDHDGHMTNELDATAVRVVVEAYDADLPS